jgi:serine/threonine-protein kinase
MAGTRPQESTDPLVLLGKQLLGRYIIQSRLAQGGMSVVYQGRDERLQRPVCLKVFFGLNHSDASYQASYEHFVQEAFALSQLQHPNTIRIYDFGYLEEEPRSPFHVSELMEGGTLRAQVKSMGLLSPRAAADILEPIVGALSEAHGRGIIHRDIKPTNILFGRAGTRVIVKLCDFGIAKADAEVDLPNRADDTRSLTGKRISFFSPAWGAPEQLRGKKVGPTADVFALGLVTVYMLSGKKVFEDRDLPKMIEQRGKNDEFIEKRLAALSIGEPIARVVLRACRNKPEERYATIDQLGTAMRAALRGGDQVTTNRFEKLEPSEIPTKTTSPRGLPAMPDSPASVAGQAALLSPLEPGEVVAAGRRLKLIATTDEHLDIESQLQGPQGALRFRLTLLPGHGVDARLHIKGLNCFVAKAGGRTSNAVDVDSDVEVKVLSADRKHAGDIRCAFGQPTAEARLFAVGSGGVGIAHADAASAVLLDFGDGRDALLLYKAKRGTR